MRALREWIEGLEELGKDPGSTVIIQQRLLVPGSEPLKLKRGLITLDPQAKVETIGKTPQAWSVLTWLKKQSKNEIKPFEIGESIGALMSLITNRRIEVLTEMTMQQQGHPEKKTFAPLLTTMPDRSVYGPVDSPITFNKDFRNRLSQICSLEEKDSEAIEAAISLHQGAMLLFEDDVPAAYVLLIAAAETLSQQFGTPHSKWDEWDEHPSWEEFIATQKLSAPQAQALKDKLMRNRHIRLKATFANYLSKETPETLWAEFFSEWSFQIVMNNGNGSFGKRTKIQERPVREILPADRKILLSAAKASYDARSGFVHKGSAQVTLASTVVSLIKGMQPKEPIPFPILRLIVRSLILKELDNRSSAYELPAVYHEIG